MMGVGARWVCHTCKTVCPRGGRPIFKSVFKRIPNTLTVSEAKGVKVMVCDLLKIIELRPEDEERLVSFLDDLITWLGRHEGHQIHIGSDYSTDLMDLDDYWNETVDGKISVYTRHEERVAGVQRMEDQYIEQIAAAIQQCVDNPEEVSVANTAQELYNRFSIKDL